MVERMKWRHAMCLVGCALASFVILAASPGSSAQAGSDTKKAVKEKEKKAPRNAISTVHAAIDSPVAAKSEAPDAHAAQNPIASMISIPFQNNTGFDVGPNRRPLNVLLIEPVIPVKLNADWNLVTRWITPVINTPRVSASDGAEFGIGNLQPQFYLTPSHPGSILWAIGPQFWLPTASDKTFGLNKWGAGPAAAALTIQGPWVVGVLINNIWAGTEGDRVNKFTVNPFVDYNLANGWYLMSSPVVTSDWLAPSGQQWTLPVGGGVGRVFKVGEQAVNARVQVFNNVIRPAYAASWQLQFQVQLMYPAT